MCKILICPIGGFGDGKTKEEVGRNCCLIQDNGTGASFLYDAGVLVRRLEYQERRMVDIHPSRALLCEYIENGADIQAVYASHAHLDHLGAISKMSNYVSEGKPDGYILTEAEKKMLIPAFMSKTAFDIFCQICHNNARQDLLPNRGLEEDSDKNIQKYLPYNLREEYVLSKEEQFLKNGSVKRIGGLNVTFYEVNHSIPETMWMEVEGHGKRVVFCSDFRLAGFKPEEEKTREAIRAITAKGTIDYVFMDALYASAPGFTGSEYGAVEVVEQIARDRLKKGKKVILTYHASNLRLMEELYKMTERLTSKPMAFVGRSMINSANIGKLQAGPPNSSSVISMTGCQAEGGDAPSALVLRAKNIRSDYVVIFCSGVISDNEEAVRNLVYQLDDQGAEVILNNGERERFAKEGYEIPWHCCNVGVAHTHESGHEKRDGKREVVEAFIKANLASGRKIVFTPYHGGKGDYESFAKDVVPRDVPGVEVKIIKNGETFEI